MRSGVELSTCGTESLPKAFRDLDFTCISVLAYVAAVGMCSDSHRTPVRHSVVQLLPFVLFPLGAVPSRVSHIAVCTCECSVPVSLAHNAFRVHRTRTHLDCQWPCGSCVPGGAFFPTLPHRLVRSSQGSAEMVSAVTRPRNGWSVVLLSYYTIPCLGSACSCTHVYMSLTKGVKKAKISLVQTIFYFLLEF